MTTATLTPRANQAPAVVNVTTELSGPEWVTRFPGSTLTSDLTSAFRTAVDGFLAALSDAGAHYRIRSTYRPPQRAYLMHWAHEIFRNGFDPADVPPMEGVHIKWNHATAVVSVRAAELMVKGFDIGGLDARVPPALDTLHTSREAIDMTITWEGTLSVAKHDGTTVDIESKPWTGMNANLAEIGRGYGVIKFVGGNTDKPHWSTTGH
jgi:hypothetical protein